MLNDVAGSFEPDFNVEISDAASSFEPDCNVEVNDAAVVSDDDSLEENIGEASEIRVEYNSNYKDIYYEASKLRTHESGFTDSDAEASDDVSDVHAGVGDKVRVGIDDHNGNFDSLHIVDELDLDGPPRKQRFPEFNTTVDISDPTFKEQYKKLYDYLAELRSSNPGTTTILQLNESVFERLYICMQAMKDEFKAGCRPIICLDGYHLKSYYEGQLLATVGMDANDSLYPLAFVVVEVESESSWLYNNFKIGGDHKGKSLKDQLWKAARTTYVGEFEADITTLQIRRASEPTVHQDQSTTPSPRPSQSGIHPQSNTPRPSQPLPPAYTARWMPTPTVPFTQESHTASPSQSRIHPQSNILMPSQPLPPSYTAKWMPTPTVPFT
ncbi:hypothetical protein V6N13_072544 [Hibiscus sabdariffa]